MQGGLKNVKGSHITVYQIGIQYPYAPAVGCDDDDIIPWMYNEIVYIGGWKVSEDAVGHSSVPADINAYICPNVYNIFVKGIFPYNIDRSNGNIS